MSDRPHHDLPRGRLGAVLRDVHFWVPVAVLVAGLAVLRWIA